MCSYVKDRCQGFRMAVCLAGVGFLLSVAGGECFLEYDNGPPRTPTLRGAKRLETPKISIPPTPDVADPVLAYLTSMLEADVYDTLTAAEIERASQLRRGESLIPVACLRWLSRGMALHGPHAVTTIELTKAQAIPAPYSLLGYHPGSVLVPERIVLLEWRIGDLTIREQRRKKLVKLKDCYLWAIENGTVAIDIDSWVDALLGGSIDDITVRSLALFRLDGYPYAMAMGFNRKGEGRSGALDLRKNELVFPTPWQLKAAGKLLRRIALRRLKTKSRDHETAYETVTGSAPAGP